MVGNDALEWRVSLDRFGSEGPLDVIRVDIQDCSEQGGSCPIRYEIDGCAYHTGF